MNLKDLENQSIYIIREVISKFKNVASLFTIVDRQGTPMALLPATEKFMLQ